MKIAVVNGPNLALLGKREPGMYGNMTLTDVLEQVSDRASQLGVSLTSFQSDDEGALVQYIGSCAGSCDGILINPAAYTHTSVALHDAIRACGVPCVEVHLSNTLTRESFRHTSLTAGVCIGQVMGFGAQSYSLALEGLVTHLAAAHEG